MYQASRKTRYPEDFGWNLQSLVTILLSHIRDRHNDLSSKVGVALESGKGGGEWKFPSK